MFLRWNASGSRRSDDGKFRSRPRMGVGHSINGKHRDWSFHLINHQSGASVKRTVYHVEIRDPHDNKIVFLRDFATAEKATAGARRWIDERLNLVHRLNTGKSVGAVPKLPDQEK